MFVRVSEEQQTSGAKRKTETRNNARSHWQTLYEGNEATKDCEDIETTLLPDTCVDAENRMSRIIDTES